jgi:hypothetical protein
MVGFHEERDCFYLLLDGGLAVGHPVPFDGMIVSDEEGSLWLWER